MEGRWWKEGEVERRRERKERTGRKEKKEGKEGSERKVVGRKGHSEFGDDDVREREGERERGVKTRTSNVGMVAS